MTIGQIRKLHRFLPYDDVRYKASYFKNQLAQLQSLGIALEKTVQHELNQCSGSFIEEAVNILAKNQQTFQAIASNQLSNMGPIAEKYNTQINEMNNQDITIYYEEVKTTVPE